MSDPQEIKDILDGLEEPTADDVYHETRVYDVRYLAAAAAAVAKAGGGGGGSTPDLAQVLAEGNDAGTADILGVGDLAANSATLAEIHGVGFLTYTAGPSILPLGGDPTAGGGTPAPVGSLGLRTNGQKWSKTGAGDTAWEQLGASEPQFLFASDTDPFVTNPGAVVAGAVWMDTTHEPATLKVRDSTNSLWAFTVHMGELDFGGSPEGGVDGATYYRFTPFSGGFTIEEDGSKINCDTPLDMQGQQIKGLDEGTDPSDAATVSQLGGSGAESVRLVDCGVVTAEVILTGPVTLYTPEAGELVYGVLLRDVTLTDAGPLVVYGEGEVDPGDLPPTVIAMMDDSNPLDSFGLAADQARLPSTDQPLMAASVASDTIVDVPAPPWQALTAYDVGDCVTVQHSIPGSDPWTVFRVTDDGVSGATEPDWQPQPDPTTDGTVTWEDVNNVSSVGSFHVYAHVRSAS